MVPGDGSASICGLGDCRRQVASFAFTGIIMHGSGAVLSEFHLNSLLLPITCRGHLTRYIEHGLTWWVGGSVLYGCGAATLSSRIPLIT